MGKGAIDDRDPLSLMAVGLQARDHVLSGFDRADLVICVGYDAVEYAPDRWNPDLAKRILAIDTQPAEVDASYQPEVELVGDIGGSLTRILAALAWRDAPAPGRATRRGLRDGDPRRPARATRRTAAGRSSPRRRSSTCAEPSRPMTC